MKRFFFLLVLLPFRPEAQPAFRFYDSIPVQQYGNFLSDAWAGGINFPQWGEIDIDNDGKKDLFMFDRSDNRVLIFVNDGSPGPSAFHYVDSFKTHFPRLKGWAFLYDYNVDGFPDLFSVSRLNSGIIQYKGHYDVVNGFTFTVADSVILYKYGANLYSNILASGLLVPDFNDIDNDGDMDIIAQQTTCVGTYAYYRNNALEDGGTPDTLNHYSLVTNSWGNYFLRPGGYNYAAVGGYHISCFHASEGPIEYHPEDAAQRDDTYSAIRTIDLDGDGDKDVLSGDSQAINLLAVYNGGDSSYADMNAQDTLFPSYNTPALMKSFTAPSFADVDNDGKTDLLVGNNEFEDRRGVKWYKNTGSNTAPVYDFQSDSLFQPGMIDVGEAAAAVFSDIDNDGLTDMVIGNSRSTFNFSQEKTNLTFYKNTGTATNPSFQFVTDDFASASSLGLAGPLFPAFGDLDNDGDKDMIVGVFNGTLVYFTNTGGTFNFTTANYMNIDVGNGSTPQLIDVNRDGKLDLLIGEQNGYVNYFENTGTLTTPFFSNLPTINFFGNIDARSPGYPDGYTVPYLVSDSGRYRLYVANMDGNVFLYDSIDGNLGGTFHFVDTVINRHVGYRYGYCLSVSGADLNADGRTDLLLGLYGGGVQVYYQVDPFLSVPDFANRVSSFTVYPNPASATITITLESYRKTDRYVLSIFNAIGQCVYTDENVQQKNNVDVSKFPEGIYFIQLSSADGSVGNKIVISKN